METATATITITDNGEHMKINVEYDPLPVSGSPPSNAAIVANKMVQLFAQTQSDDAILSNTMYDSRTGETFTKERKDNE